MPECMNEILAGDSDFLTPEDIGALRGALLRAYDKATGKDAGSVFMPAQQTGSPMTYMLNGRQYVSIASGNNILTFALK